MKTPIFKKIFKKYLERQKFELTPLPLTNFPGQ
jgi:hypothetical protein